MKVKCVNNEAFEDQLTKGEEYRGTIKNGSILVRNDNNAFGWYGLGKFEFVESNMDISKYQLQAH